MKISVIIPVYNTGKYISRCLDSVLNQSLRDIEILVVNDCTPDGAMSIVTEYANKDERLHIIHNSVNMGQMLTREIGCQHALGDYIVFCDSDDYLPADALEKMYVAIEQSKADIIVSAFTYICVSGKQTKIISKISGGTTAIDAYKALFNNELSHSLCAKIYSRQLFGNCKYDMFEKQTNAEDYMLFCQLLQHTSKIECIDVSTYYYCQNLQSSSQSYSDDKFMAFVNAINWQYAFFKDMDAFKTDSLIDILNSMLCILKAGCKQHVVLKINPEILDLLSFSKLRKYMGIFQTGLFYILYRFPVLRFIYSYCGRMKKYTGLVLNRFSYVLEKGV